MTIRLQGGVFGRNSTFVEGNLPDTVLVDTDIGVTVQGYDADTAKLDVVQTFTATQRIDANVGIRTSPSFLLGDGLHIKGTDYANITLQKSALNWGHAVDFVDDTGVLEFRLGTNFSSGGTNFLVAHTSGLAFKIDTSRNVTITNGNLVIGTPGRGIEFSTTPGTGTSELLDDYEEGTWVPTLTTLGTNFSSVSYITQEGKYTKVGRVVHLSGVIFTSGITKGSASGDVVIGGLPFPGASGDIMAGCVSDARFWTSNTPSAVEFRGSNNYLYLWGRSSSTLGTTQTAVADVNTGAEGNLIVFSCTYFV